VEQTEETGICENDRTKNIHNLNDFDVGHTPHLHSTPWGIHRQRKERKKKKYVGLLNAENLSSVVIEDSTKS
jgi:hypothetical protein